MTLRLIAALLAVVVCPAAHAQEARRRFEMMRRIRLDKFGRVLPQAMRENRIDPWIVATKQNHPDPLWEDLGGGFIGATGYFVFADRGDRIEKAVFDIDVGIGPPAWLRHAVGPFPDWTAEPPGMFVCPSRDRRPVLRSVRRRPGEASTVLPRRSTEPGVVRPSRLEDTPSAARVYNPSRPL